MSTQRKFENIDGQWKLVEVCQERPTYHTSPRDVTHNLWQHLPFDSNNNQRYDSHNFIGIKLESIHLKPGGTYMLNKGKRIIYEVGCSTITFLYIDSSSPYNYHFFIQPTQSFLWDVTIRDISERVANATAPMVTVVKYEMYFILGLISTLSIPALMLVVGSDFTISSLAARDKFRATRKLVKALADEDHILETHFPVTRRKIREFIISEASNNAKRTLNSLPRAVATDEQTQATLAGTLLGKATVSPNVFTGWTAMLTVLTTAAVKSATLSPQTYGLELDRRFTPIIQRITNIDWGNTDEIRGISLSLIDIFKDSNVVISEQEASQILKEITNKPRAALESLKKTESAFKEFNREMSAW